MNWHFICYFYFKPDMIQNESSTHIAKILIIEDDNEMRSLLNDFFLEEGFKTDSVDNGSEAFRKLAKGSFDLIITDVKMPGLTGLDILPGIKKLQPEVPIIVITAFGSEDVHRKAFERGATAYLEKPIHLHQLRRLMNKMISSTGGKFTGE
jgi:DNA-binding response OmpR family regulator